MFTLYLLYITQLVQIQYYILDPSLSTVIVYYFKICSYENHTT
jgi:hypothetical protein